MQKAFWKLHVEGRARRETAVQAASWGGVQNHGYVVMSAEKRLLFMARYKLRFPFEKIKQCRLFLPQ